MTTGDDAEATRLEEERREVVERLAELRRGFDGIVEASRDSNADDEHDPEGVTIAFERAQVAALVAQAEAHLTRVEAALDRIGSGDYGRCEVCGEAIPAARLEALPTARTCVPCASRRPA